MMMLGGLDESSKVILWSLWRRSGSRVRSARSAWPWFGAFVATVVIRSLSPRSFGPTAPICPKASSETFDVLNIVVVSLVAMLLLVTFARGRDTAQARVEALLLNILPAEVAERLQSDPSSIADHFDEASILFADVVDFTPLSSRLDAREVVGLLDRLFTSFDELVDHYDVEKIKTIGDCLHGRCRRSAPARRPRAGARRARARDAGVRAHVLARSPTDTTFGSASGSAPGRSSPA